MTKDDFKKAIEAMGIMDLEILRFSEGVNGQTVAVYARMGQLTWIKWDYLGRGFRFDQPADMEGCVSSENVMYLSYDRDSYLDLKF